MDDHIKKVYWRKNEIAKELGVKSCTLTYWEKYFGDIFFAKRVGGKRLYGVKGKGMFQEIHRLSKVEKYTLEGVKRKLKNYS